jgi:hypothetical protein
MAVLPQLGSLRIFVDLQTRAGLSDLDLESIKFSLSRAQQEIVFKSGLESAQ